MAENTSKLKLLITGASGFLGQYVVAEALEQGYQVRALIRPTTDKKSLPWCDHPQLELMGVDLLNRQDLTKAVKGVDGVIHLAAAKQGDYDTQYRGTVVATENLLAAMVEMGVLRLIAISTFSVYDYLHIPAGEIIDEKAAIESKPENRDIYAITKLIQAEKVQNFPGKVTILRPGIIYGPDNIWNAHQGVSLKNKFWIRISNERLLPLTYVENCAEAIVKAVECDKAIGETLNIVDDNLPTQDSYWRAIAQRVPSPPKMIVVNWPLVRLIADLSWQFNQNLFKGRLKVPGILVPSRLQARFKPFNYSNSKAKEILNWQPKYSLEAALDKILAG